MIGAGLVAKKAVERGLHAQAVGQDQPRAGLEGRHRLPGQGRPAARISMQLGFNLVGYGCTTCIGNSGPLPDEIAAEVRERGLVVCSVLSAATATSRAASSRTCARTTWRRRRWSSPTRWPDDERRPDDRAARHRPRRQAGVPEGHLADRAGDSADDAGVGRRPEMFRQQYASVFEGDERWRALPVPTGDRFAWEDDSTYIRRPPFLENLSREPAPPHGHHAARACWRVLGDSITTDHISPAGSIKADSPAGKYLIAHGVAAEGLQLLRRAARQSRGDDARHVRQRAAAEPAGARHRRRHDRRTCPDGEVMTIYDAAMQYQRRGRAARSSSPARSTARDRRATGRRRARCCSA